MWCHWGKCRISRGEREKGKKEGRKEGKERKKGRKNRKNFRKTLQKFSKVTVKTTGNDLTIVKAAR